MTDPNDLDLFLQPAPAPDYQRFRPELVEPGMRALLAELERELAALEADCAPSWERSLVPFERIGDRLEGGWKLARHHMAVKNSAELRKAHDAVQADVVRFSMKLAQSPALHASLKALTGGEGWSELSAERQRIVECVLRDMELAGVGLAGAARERFNAIQLELAELSTRFTNNVIDATREYGLVLRTEAEVAGLSEGAREQFARAARDAGESGATAAQGPWRVTLDGPSYLAFMKNAARRDLRRELHLAYVQRASAGELDNDPLIERILALRAEKAALLGYGTYAELSLASKMAPSVAEVERLLEELRAPAYERAQDEVRELAELARSRGAEEGADLQDWDRAYWAERLREARYDLDEEHLRAWFPMPRVLDGLFALAERLFGVRVRAADGEVPVWHPDVRFFRLSDADGAPRAALYLDPYSRPSEKRGGAWQASVVGRSRVMAPADEAVRLPVGIIVCNGTPPAQGRPSLMTFAEVKTLFHEFGHALQHMLTTVDEGLASGTANVEWDAVELASQFMENWLYHRPTLLGISGHHETGEPLPEALFDKLCAARNHMAGSSMLRQIDFGLVDLALHHGYEPGGAERVADVRRRVAERTLVLPLPEEDRFLCGFQHIFAGGYAAGYYSYKWAEVLSADAFAAFEEAGLDDERALQATGRRYRDTVLALGGSRHPMDVFAAFRGRAPSTEPLLRHAGLL